MAGYFISFTFKMSLKLYEFLNKRRIDAVGGSITRQEHLASDTLDTQRLFPTFSLNSTNSRSVDSINFV